MYSTDAKKEPLIQTIADIEVLSIILFRDVECHMIVVKVVLMVLGVIG